MKKIYILFLIGLMSVALGVKAADRSDDTSWKKVSENVYIDSDGIVGTSEIYGFTFLLKSYNKGQYEPINGRDVLYTLGQYTIDCGHRRYKIGVIDSYDRNNNFIYGDYNRFAEFQPIVANTAVGIVANKLCRE